MMSEFTCEAWIEQLVAAVPGLKCLYDEHIKDYDELLPHVFLADVTRYVTQGFESESDGSFCPTKHEGAIRALEFLEVAAGSKNDKLVELVSVSFLENVDWDDDKSQMIRSAMGPNLEAEQVRREEW